MSPLRAEPIESCNDTLPLANPDNWANPPCIVLLALLINPTAPVSKLLIAELKVATAVLPRPARLSVMVPMGFDESEVKELARLLLPLNKFVKSLNRALAPLLPKAAATSVSADVDNSKP